MGSEKSVMWSIHVIVKISTTESGLVVEKNKNIPLYANEIMLREAKNEVSNDCQIELYGLKIMIINKIIKTI